MAKFTSSIDEAHWTSALRNHSVAERAWSAVELEEDCRAREQAELALRDARSALYSVPAPDLAAVRKNLMIWWGENLWDDDYANSLNRIVIGDLTRIGLQMVGGSEAEASGRSCEEAAQDAEQWRTAVADYHEEERLFIEGPSPRWGGREAINLIDAMHYAAGTLLELPAPNLGGVVRKLELLWEDDRFETIEDGAIYVHIMRDLNRLSSQTDQAGRRLP